MVFNFKTYNELITFARSQYRFKGDGTYYELHHIIPRNNGGTDDKSNLVLLTVAEHVEAHYLYALEHIDNLQLYHANIQACILIIYPKNSYIKKDKQKAIEAFLQNDSFKKLVEDSKARQAQYCKEHPTNKGKTFYFEHKWFQYKNQKPVSITLKSVSKYREKGYIELPNCPICHQPNSRDNFCCNEDHKQQYLNNCKQASIEFVKNNTILSWQNNVRRNNTSQAISAAYEKRAELQEKGLLDKKHWIHNDTEAFQVNESDISSYLEKGYILGRTDKVEKVILTEKEKYKKRSEAQLSVSEKKKETWKNKEWTIEDSKKRSEATCKGIANSEWYKYPKCWVHRDNKTKQIFLADLDQYILNGWIKGRGKLK